MITKTRLQFLAALFLTFLPFLGFPVWLDTILVSALGIFIVFTTFLSARERRLKSRSANMVDAPKEVDVKVTFEKQPAKRTVRRKPKEVMQEVAVPIPGPELKPAMPGEDLGPLEVVNPEPVEQTASPTPVKQVSQVETESLAQDVATEVKLPAEPKITQEPVKADMKAMPSPLAAESIVKKVSRRRAKTPVFVSESDGSE